MQDTKHNANAAEILTILGDSFCWLEQSEDSEVDSCWMGKQLVHGVAAKVRFSVRAT